MYLYFLYRSTTSTTSECVALHWDMHQGARNTCAQRVTINFSPPQLATAASACLPPAA